MERVTSRLADFATSMEYGDLPPDVIERTKQVLLDAIGCCLGGYAVDRSRFAVGYAEECGGNEQASIIGGGRTTFDLAAFVNAELVCALDFEAVGPLTAHVLPYVLSPVLAMAERVHASGAELIMGVALAHEIGGRVASSLASGTKMPIDDPPYYRESPRHTYSTAIFGGVAGAGRLIGLDAEEMANAFGIAGASCPVPATVRFQHITEPAIMVKFNAWSGWVCRLATTAVLIAEKGFTGDPAILDGEWGFGNIVGSPYFKVERLLDGLGDTWHIGEMEFKAYPCCRLNHTGIDAIKGIMEVHHIAPQEIEEIVLKGDPNLLMPIRMHEEVKNFADTQFTNSYICAVAAYCGERPGPDWQLPGTFKRPEIKALMKKVKVDALPQAAELLAARVKAGLSAAFRNSFVKITARGQRFTREVNHPKGSSYNPMTVAELTEKFKINASYSPLPERRIREIIDMVERLEQLDDCTELTRLLTVR